MHMNFTFLHFGDLILVFISVFKVFKSPWNVFKVLVLISK